MRLNTNNYKCFDLWNFADSVAVCEGTTGDTCISDCLGQEDGDYQSCAYCNTYHSCVNQKIYRDRPCAEEYLFWDDTMKRCEWSSATCDGASKPRGGVTRVGGRPGLDVTFQPGLEVSEKIVDEIHTRVKGSSGEKTTRVGGRPGLDVTSQPELEVSVKIVDEIHSAVKGSSGESTTGEQPVILITGSDGISTEVLPDPTATAALYPTEKKGVDTTDEGFYDATEAITTDYIDGSNEEMYTTVDSFTETDDSSEDYTTESNNAYISTDGFSKESSDYDDYTTESDVVDTSTDDDTPEYTTESDLVDTSTDDETPEYTTEPDVVDTSRDDDTPEYTTESDAVDTSRDDDTPEYTTKSDSVDTSTDESSVENPNQTIVSDTGDTKTTVKTTMSATTQHILTFIGGDDVVTAYPLRNYTVPAHVTGKLCI